MGKRFSAMMVAAGRRESEMDREMYDPSRRYPIAPESRHTGDRRGFQDDKGRWHYRNGEYAPEGSIGFGRRDYPDYGDMEPERERRGAAAYYDDGEPMRRVHREGRRHEPMTGYYEEPYYPDGYPIRGRYPDTDGVPTPIDAPDDDDDDDETKRRARRYSMGAHYDDGYEHGTDDRRIGFVSGRSGGAHHFDKEMAMRWAQELENDDGTTGPHWDLEQTKRIMAQYGMDAKPYIGYIVLNMMYSDYSSVFKKRGVNDIETYAMMAKSFIDDVDAKPIEERLYNYYEYIFAHK